MFRAGLTPNDRGAAAASVPALPAARLIVFTPDYQLWHNALKLCGAQTPPPTPAPSQPSHPRTKKVQTAAAGSQPLRSY